MAQTMDSLLQNSRLKLKKVGKTTRSFRYDQNKRAEFIKHLNVTHTFKGLDLIESLKTYIWRFMTLYRRQ